MRWWCIPCYIALLAVAGCFRAGEDSRLSSSSPCTCGDASVFEGEDSPDTSAPRPGGTLHIRIASEPNSLLSLVDPDPVVRLVADGSIFESLVQVSADGKALQPALAVSWKEHPDLTSYSFRIDPNATWHDGKPVTAGDVEYTFSKIIDPDSHVAVKSEFSDISELTVSDKHTIRVKLDRPRPGFLTALARVPILPAHVFGRTPLASHPAARAPVGSGPFRFSRWVSGQSIELERNPAWRGAKPLVERIHYRLVIGHQIAMNLFKKGSLDIVLDLPSSTIWNQPYGSLITYPLPRFGAWIANTTRPVFTTPTARQAMGMLIDRATIRCSILRCRADFAEGPWYGDHAEIPEFPPPFSFDPAGAVAALEKDGWVDSNDNRIRDRDGVEFSFELLLPDGGRDLRRAAAVVQTDLAKVGIEMRISAVEPSTYFSRLRSRRFDASIITVANHKMFDPSPLFHSRAVPTGENYCGFSDPELDPLLDSLRAERDAAARLELKRQISISLRSSAPAVFTFRPHGVALIQDHVRAWKIENGRLNALAVWLDRVRKTGGAE